VNGWPFQGQPLKDKIGAAFVTGGGISAGEELTQLNLLHSMLIFNMIVVGGDTWRQPFGASGITDENPFTEGEVGDLIHPQFLVKGEALGRRVAALSQRVMGTGTPD
jgi:NAD(P)H dehydrogenase (quinone)